jgi:glutamine amidotransferase
MIAIIDYKAGNLKSVERALNKLGFPCRITHERVEILSAERIIFPGVGAAG